MLSILKTSGTTEAHFKVILMLGYGTKVVTSKLCQKSRHPILITKSIIIVVYDIYVLLINVIHQFTYTPFASLPR